ncbi:hypothetical protein ACFVXG_38230 [Kitasatospora sp. NPDC058162]|uniref:hypothetical protein n=1 Tax=Kitasatospora sp. NPDC058162 TaxID=3346362 RepID=UPI0036D76D87
MMGTARQVELLRAEVGQILREGLKELRTDNATLRADHTALRTELTAAVTRELQEIRDELRRAVSRDRKELLEARQEIRDLRRQLDDARAGGPTPQADSPDLDPNPPPYIVANSTPAEPATAAGLDPIPHNDDAVGDHELAAPALQEQATALAAQPTPPLLAKETTVSDQTAGEPGNQPANPTTDAGMVAELTAAVSDLLPTEATATQPKSTTAPAPDNLTGTSRLEADLFRTLTRAACVGSAELLCHPHVWQFIGSRAAAASPHFQFPAGVAQERTDMVTVLLPGPSLMAVIKALYSAYWTAGSDLTSIEDRALALAYYTAITHEVRKTQPVTATAETPEPDRPRLRIVIDQRPQRTA